MSKLPRPPHSLDTRSIAHSTHEDVSNTIIYICSILLFSEACAEYFVSILIAFISLNL